MCSVVFLFVFCVFFLAKICGHFQSTDFKHICVKQDVKCCSVSIYIFVAEILFADMV